MMNKSVADARFMDVSWLRVINFKCLIPTVPICLRRKIVVERRQIIGKFQRKFCDIPATSFSA